MANRCATIACPNTATTCITYSYPETREMHVHEHVCAECAESYLNRPALRAVKMGSKVSA